MKYRVPVLAPLALLITLALGSCGGGGGGGGEDGGVTPPPELGVFTGFKDSGNLNWESTGGDGTGGVGDGGADGDGGVGAGGDFGQFRGANACVFLDNGTQLGCALTDSVKGMVTIKPGRDYRGGLRIELSGTPTATYYEEGRNTYVSFPADRKIRVWVPSIGRNIGVTPFTEAAYRLLTEGSAPESVGAATPTKDQIRAANERVRQALNEHFPTALHVDDIARLPFIKSDSLPAGSMRTDPRGRYGLVNGAFSKQASFHNGDSATPTLDATRQLAEDLLDGRIDGRNGDQPAGPATARTYDPNTFTGELSSALAEQAARFGAQEALDALPKVLNFGNVRYEGYLFDGSISKSGNAFSTVAGWVAGNARNFTTGQQFDRLPGQRALALYANNGHGGGFYKADALGPRHKVYAIGDNVNGELGLGTRDPTLGRAIELTLPGAMTHAVGGFAHTVMRLADGRVFAWGNNSFGQLGQGQGPDTLPNSLTPMQVNLPRTALAVAATNTASYALLDDGSVWSWGTNGGFGLLGNGARDGIVATPTAVAGLTQVVQISARDNDVVVVRRDNSVWHWGAFPADVDAFDPGDPSVAYRGGTLAPVAVTGLPAGVAVRKILTEQGLFAALLANGHVYHWGVHFDITAGGILRDLTAQRILGLPPVRDLMPGGFIGYGVRPFDRLTGMAVDYSGGMWKVRGRVAERFDPANPAKQNRPQGATTRPDCVSCHTFLDESLEQLLARQPSTAGLPVCQPPDTAHAPGGTSLLHAETDCVFCHNPSRANYPQLAQPFASSGSWQNCAKPTTLPPRTQSTPPLLVNSCTVPVGHVYTPPGTVCASCHNSVIARPLNTLGAPCTQPRSDELPAIATLTTITGAFDTSGNAIASGSTTTTVRHEIRGTLSQALAGGQTLEVARNGTALGNASVTGTAWTYAHPANTPDGAAAFTARIVAAGAFGRTSNAFAFNVDATPPVAVASIGGFVDDLLGSLASGAFASDTTPTVTGSISATLGAGETVQVLRAGVVVGVATTTGSTWSFTEPAALAAGSYGWTARIIDGAGNRSATSAAATLTIVTALATTNVTQIVNDANVVIAPGGTTSDSTPTIRGTTGAALPAGHIVRVLRDGAPIGIATVTATDWTFTDPGAANGPHTYVARTEAGAVLGAPSSGYSITVDTVAPTQVANVTQIADDFVGPLADGATTADTTPIVSGTLSATLAAGEQVRVLRRLNAGTFAQVALVTTASQNWSYTEPTPLANGSYTYQIQVVDAGGLLGPLGTARSVTIDAASIPLPGAATFLNTINGVTPAGAAVPVNNVVTPVLAGTLQRSLNTGPGTAERVRVYRGLNGSTPVAVGDASVTGTSWTYTNTALADGTYAFRAQVEQIANPLIFGLSSPTVTNPIDNTAPTQAVTIANIRENSGGTVVASGGYTTDTTPFVEGTLSATLAAGEQVQVLRNAVVVGTATVPGTSWTYSEGVLAGGNYSYTTRVRDAAGNLGATSAARSVNVVTNLPSTTITSINGLADGASTNDTTPTVNITLNANLPAGYIVRVLRGGVSVGTIGTCNPSCTFVDGPLPATAGTTYSYTARTEVGGTAIGATSNTRTIVLDTVAPAAPTFQVFSNNRPFQNNTSGLPTSFDGLGRSTNEVQFSSGVTTSDPDPRVQITFGVASGDTVQLFRGGTLVASTSTVGQTTLSVNHPASLSRPTSAPNSTASVVYTARRTDAAGNLVDTTFTLSAAHPACSQARALSRSATTTLHNSWPAGSPATAGCTGCHTTTNGSFMAAPPTNPETNNLGQGSWYWCAKS